MPALSRAKKKPPTVSIRELVEADAQVICIETFRPGLIAHLVSRGDHLRLDDPIVRQFPEFFALVIQLERLGDLREIERSA
jgi:hypothetical protein